MRNGVSNNSMSVTAIAVFLIASLGGQDGSGASPLEGKGDHSEEGTTWVIVRHAERQGNQDALSNAGLERAEQLQRLGEILNVSAVYSTDFNRTRNTVTPLCTARGLNMQKYQKVTADWLEETARGNRGGVVLIVGHSNTAGLIAGKLTGKPKVQIGHDDYDNLFIIRDNGGVRTMVQLKYGTANRSE